MVISGDKVRHGAHVRVAVDVTPDGFVVMRDEADLDGLDLTAATVDEVEGAGGGGRVGRGAAGGGQCWPRWVWGCVAAGSGAPATTTTPRAPCTRRHTSSCTSQ